MSGLVLQLMAVQVGLPLGLILLHAVVPAASKSGLSLRTGALALLLLYVALVGIWLFPPFWTPWAMAATLALATGAAWRRLSQRQAAGRPWLRRGEAGLAALAAAGMALLILPALQGRAVPEGAVDLDAPLGPGRYLATSGGAAAAVNAHLMTLGPEERFRPWRGQSYALDLVGIDRWGLTAPAGAAPRDPEAYVIHGAPILAPCAGRVIAVEDARPDMPVPEMDRLHKLGNHVLLDCGGFVVLLAHMAPGTVAVAEGEDAAAGDLLGRVGNSGNSAAPHLHIHVQRAAPAGAPVSGEPLWFTVQGRFLVRGDVMVVGE